MTEPQDFRRVVPQQEQARTRWVAIWEQFLIQRFIKPKATEYDKKPTWGMLEADDKKPISPMQYVPSMTVWKTAQKLK